MQTVHEEHSTWLDRPIVSRLVLNWENILFAVILILAVVSRFYILGNRVMSHDENSHVYYSWKLFRGQGFAHDPLMHGPFQFHIVALSYFLFGDSDFTARIPAVLFSIATVAFVWNYRRYLGRTGSIAAAVMMLISPYMLFYGRYVRNEAFVALYGVIGLWAILRYLETGQARFMYWLVAVSVLHFTTKETSFIYTAEALIFLALALIYRLAVNPWNDESKRRPFFYVLGGGLLALAAAGTAMVLTPPTVTPVTGLPADTTPVATSVSAGVPPAAIFLMLLALVFFAAAIVLAILGYSTAGLKRERSFDLLMILGTMVLPQLAAFPVFLLGWTLPTNASEVTALTTVDMLRLAAFLIPLLVISALIGLWWNRRLWLINAAIWYAIFIVFQTTVFTNGAGFFTGIIGSLGYWLKQQEVNRGSQPWYYYWLIQTPVYEFLPALATLLGFGLRATGVRILGWRDGFPLIGRKTESAGEPLSKTSALSQNAADQADWETPPVFQLLGFWAVASMVAFSLAGEKMPWLTVHIALPLILYGGWVIGYLIDGVDWEAFRRRNGWLMLTLLPVFFASLLSVIGSLLGAQPPFQGKTLDQLGATSTFLLALLAAVCSGLGLVYLVREWAAAQFNRIIALFIFGFLAVITARTAITSSYINYDNANELLVYAHSAGGVKRALAQIEEISLRTADGLGVQVAFDNETSYPYWWYLRNYPNQRFYGGDPTRALRDVPLILVGDANFGKIEPVVGQGYEKFEYIRLWWPNQDYFDLTWERIFDALTDPQMREALFHIWLDRDYTLYGQVTGKDMSLQTWNPSARMRLYVRKDILSSLWNYGAAPTTAAVEIDPYNKQIQLTADRIFGGLQDPSLQLQRPRDVALAPDGTLYISDTDNHRIVHVDAEGALLHTWGGYGDIAAGQAAGGLFNQPWGIAVGPDGSVYVADTWNHRIQKFDPQGKFLKMWGYFGQAETPDAIWGPRDVAVDEKGRVFVTDTGNKRVVVFDEEGNSITQFGSAGLEAGQFDEPVGLALDADGQVYVADTWNQRLQVFRDEDNNFIQVRSWDIAAWYGQSLDNKPFLAVDAAGQVFVPDPEGARVIEFKNDGTFLQFWGDAGEGANQFRLVGGVAVDGDGGLWVVDTGNNRLMHFVVPAAGS